MDRGIEKPSVLTNINEGLRGLFSRAVTSEGSSNAVLAALDRTRLAGAITEGLYRHYSDDQQPGSLGEKVVEYSGAIGGATGIAAGVAAWFALSAATNGVFAMASIPNGAFLGMGAASGVAGAGLATLNANRIIDPFTDTPRELMEDKARELVGLEIGVIINERALQDHITLEELVERIKKEPEKYQQLDVMVKDVIYALGERYSFTTHIDKEGAASEKYGENSAAMDARIEELREIAREQEAAIKSWAGALPQEPQGVTTAAYGLPRPGA